MDTSAGEIVGLIVMFWTVTVPLLIVNVPAITEFEVSVEKLPLNPPIRATEILLLKLSFPS